jgi:hypothetical protein
MTLVRAAAISALALFAAAQAPGQASAEGLFGMRIYMPRIYAPHLPRYAPRHAYDYYDEEYGSYDEDEEDIVIRRRRQLHDRNVYLDYGVDDEDLEPVYEPPVKRAVKPKVKKKVAVKKPAAKQAQPVASVVKPKVKPVAANAPVVKTTASQTALAVKPTVTSTAIKADPLLPSTAMTAPKPAAKVAPLKAVTPAPVKVASAAAPAGVIACSKGAEIVSGYGFTSVKPRTCTGTTYSFDATRAANAYLIKVSAATGEISDVQKLK